MNHELIKFTYLYCANLLEIKKTFAILKSFCSFLLIKLSTSMQTALSMLHSMIPDYPSKECGHQRDESVFFLPSTAWKITIYGNLIELIMRKKVS